MFAGRALEIEDYGVELVEVSCQESLNRRTQNSQRIDIGNGPRLISALG
jgi:hypothetical protein